MDVAGFLETLELIAKGGSRIDPALVQELVRAHDGTIDVASRPGAVTTSLRATMSDSTAASGVDSGDGLPVNPHESSVTYTRTLHPHVGQANSMRNTLVDLTALHANRISFRNHSDTHPYTYWLVQISGLFGPVRQNAMPRNLSF
jgi:hypothetical protein